MLDVQLCNALLAIIESPSTSDELRKASSELLLEHLKRVLAAWRDPNDGSAPGGKP